MIEYELDHICSYTADLANPPEVIGPVAEGIRANFYVTAGDVTGPRIQGKLRPVGGDWLTVRRDGVAVLDVRATIETNDGALILVTYHGVIDAGESGYDDFANGAISPVMPIRVAPRFTTAHPDDLWLNRLQCLGIGQTDLENSRVMYDVYAVR